MIQALGNKLRGIGPMTMRFLRQPSGATAVEFGVIAVPFFFLKFAIIETALIFWAGQMLDTGVSEAGRQIRTGQVQAAGVDAEGFRAIMCEEIGVLFDCGERMAVDVQRVARFDAVDLSRPPVNDDGEFTGAFGFDPGQRNETVIVRVFYRWPVLFNFFGVDAADIGGRQRLLSSTTAFRNEPF